MALVVPHKQRDQTDGENGGIDVHDKERLVVCVVREDVAGQEVGRGPQEDGDEEQRYAEGATSEASQTQAHQESSSPSCCSWACCT